MKPEAVLGKYLAVAAVAAVAEVSVIAVADKRWGETPAAIITAAPTADIDEATVHAYRRDELSDYKSAATSCCVRSRCPGYRAEK